MERRPSGTAHPAVGPVYIGRRAWLPPRRTFIAVCAFGTCWWSSIPASRIELRKILIGRGVTTVWERSVVTWPSGQAKDLPDAEAAYARHA
jgi:hypothetical protein